VSPEKSFLADPWRNLRRSGAYAAWFFTLFYAIPIVLSLRRNTVGSGDGAHLVWTIGVAFALAAACIIGVKLWRTEDRTTQWQLTGVAWVLILGAVASSRLFVGGDQ
jgi:hypothetical protein